MPESVVARRAARAETSAEPPASVRVIDSHTEGEPTRVIVDGMPQPGGDTMAERRDDLRARFDHLRRAIVCEPRGYAAIVGALLTPPVSPQSLAGIVFFNNATYLGMCGHGLIGVVRTLAHMGRLEPGVARFDTPVGQVSAELNDDGSVTIENVAAHCHALDAAVSVPDLGLVTGDVAYGGNWFFITHLDMPLELSNIGELTRVTQSIQDAIDAQGTAGDVPIDHIEISGAPHRADADARNFVLCSGGEYDRSPCGTGTSAVMATLHARGRLAIGQVWRQESITGSRFTGWLTQSATGELVPHIRGRAFVTGEATLRFDPADPFRLGIAEP
ncbi:MAG TPA: proline racemase family protein [Gemmatimonadaceae bacterium]|jgi:proline racemase|nr:proline racemase family protein [Gemmatimonadaceae bacterium]